MNEQKMCPLKRGGADDFLVFQNIEVNKAELAILRETGAMCIRPFDNEEQKVEIVSGKCDGPRCAWWSAERSCCGVVVGR